MGDFIDYLLLYVFGLPFLLCAADCTGATVAGSAPDILHFALCTLHFALCTLHFAFCILHFSESLAKRKKT